MSDTVISTTFPGPFTMPGVGDTLLVTSSGSVIGSSVLNGIESQADSQLITLDGLAFGQDAIAVGGNITTVLVNGDAEGYFAGLAATTSESSITVGSQGTIEGKTYGVQFVEDIAPGGGQAETFNALTNHGTIQSLNVGAAVKTFGDGGDLFSNSGMISGLSTGIQFQANTGTQTVENSGTIESTDGPAISSTQLFSSLGQVYTSVGVSIVNSAGGLLTNATSNPSGPYQGVLFFDDGAGTTSTIDNQGNISGTGYVIQSASDALEIANSGAIHGGLFSSAAVVIDNSGTWQSSTTSDGLVLDSRGSELINTGAIDASIFFGVGGDVFKNHNQVYGDVTLGASDTFVNTGVVHGDVTLGVGDTIKDSRGTVTGAFTASTSDLFAYAGHFGEETINGFVTGSGNDVIQFAANDFGSFGQVMGSTHQVGLDTVIGLDATDSITLVGVAKSSLVPTDFKFV
jgi:hypothetical protein